MSHVAPIKMRKAASHAPYCFTVAMPGAYGRRNGDTCRGAGRNASPASNEAVMEIFDITVIGGGPSGLFALFYAGMRGAKAKVIDVLPELGGQLYALYPEKYIYDMPGFPAIIAQDLVKGCVEQAFQWPHARCLEERVTDIARDEDGAFTIVTDKARHRTRAIVLTTGIGAFSPRKLAAPTAERFEGSGLNYYARAFDEFAGLRVTIVGGGD